ncbi:DMT family transporter [Myxococcus sp. RHSTA-1-4]|uniref:DMT family transporter n=1 Tax=Myxococcus sp. RHSTA-1-4 TaxID=2874601 RepID=UPI001CBE7487|nr:DMT family transporter [Myxococcus sp. RHSTA-1-4]MBZ4421682.1 DMT family transporter [Myxococcus sp. RHSTA-1-4]
MRTGLLTVLALVGFAANSLLCRAALAGGGRLIDAASFTGVRLVSGALVLALLLRARSGRHTGGSWPSALALFAYAAGFSLAYVRIPTGVGALLLFGCVQATMLGTGLARGERPKAREVAGLLLALGGLVGLTAPGVSAPDPVGAAMMAGAGVAWGVYSLRGRGNRDPLAATADNFLRSVPMAVALSGVGLLAQGTPHATGRGIALALASGALASGVGYSLWYAALPHLTATRAAIIQLSVPVLAAAGGVLLLGEGVTARVLLAGTALLAGVLLALSAKAAPRKPAAASGQE